MNRPQQTLCLQDRRQTASRARARAVAAAAKPVVESLEDRTLLSTWVVTNTNDSGTGSLRWAIDQANQSNGHDTITFNITSANKTIRPLTEMSGAYQEMTIDATTQPGYNGKPLIRIDGSQAVTGDSRPADGIKLFGNDVLRGLDITGFKGSAISTIVRPDRNYGGNLIEYNWVGVGLDGTTVIPNTAHGVCISTPGNTVQNNVLSGSLNGMGVYIGGPNNGNNIIQNNLIGTDASGTRAAGNATGAGTGESPNNQFLNNVISASREDGFITFGVTATGNVLRGNKIGTDVTGTKALGNGTYGVELQTDSNSVGGPGAADGNVVSANGIDGIICWGGNKTLVENNKVGTDLTGLKPLGNLGHGIYDSGTGNQILYNVVGANVLGGINVFPGTGSTVQGNFVGVGPDGATALPNLGSAGVYICSNGGTGATIKNNTIAYNAGEGILDQGTGPTIVYNTIYNNQGSGINMGKDFQNRVEANSIYNNGQLGIDVNGNGVSPNVAANVGDWPNYPVLSSASSDVSSTTVAGSLVSVGGKSYTIDFYASPTADPSGYGEGKTYLGSTTVALGGSGNGTFTAKLPVATPAGYVVSATAMDPSNNTSEFSKVVTVSGNNTVPAPAPTASINSVSSAEGNSGTKPLTFTVSLSAASAQTITLNYKTVDGTATTADNDYQGASGTVTFSPGQTTQTINVNVVGDTKVEADETFSVVLSNPSNATIGNATGVGTIVNDDTAPIPTPTLSIGNASTTEGNSGTKALTFTVSLSAPSAQTVTASYNTIDGTATVADNDYQAASGTVTFAPGQTTQTLTVNVVGDTKVESDETFSVVLSSPTNATIASGTAMGTITNDDTTPTGGGTTGTGGGSFSAHVNFGPAGRPTPTGYVADTGLVFGDRGNGLSYGWDADNTANAFDRWSSLAADQRYNTFVDMQPATGINRTWEIAVPNGTYTVHIADGDASSWNEAVRISAEGQTVINSSTSSGNHWIEGTATVTVTDGRLTITSAGSGTHDKIGYIDITGTGTNGGGGGGTTPTPIVPTVSIGNTSVVEGNSGATNAVFSVTLSAATTQTVTVKYATADGTATTADNDYQPASGTLTFAPGQTNQTFSVPVVGDTKVESDETFGVVLSSPGNATIATGAGTGTIVNDDTAPTGGGTTGATFSAHINFGPSGRPTPSGYVADVGQIFGSRSNGLSYGWNVDTTANAFDRWSTLAQDQRYNTFAELNPWQTPTDAKRVWEIAVPNGTYSVHLVSGDAVGWDETYSVTVEGQSVYNTKATSANRWVEGTVTVTVTDGRLTIGSGAGAYKSNIDYVDIASVGSSSSVTPAVYTVPLTKLQTTKPNTASTATSSLKSNTSLLS